jgi:bacillopeptidase F
MPRPTSRLERKERQKILKQTYLFLGGAVVIGVLFIFLVIPSFIRILNAVFSGGDSFLVEDTIPPQVPIISAPVDATTSSALELTGFAEAESAVIILLNGQAQNEVQAATDGVFTASVLLQEGENALSAYSRDAAGNESEPTRTFLVLLDTEPPILDIIEPEDGQRVEGVRNQTLAISGATDPRSKVYLNERIIFPREDGSFSSSFFLSEGENILQFKSIDLAGNETLHERVVTFVR